MNEWRDGYGQGRDIFQLDGKYFCFHNNDPEDGSLMELTDEYRDEDGNFIAPDTLAPDDANGKEIRHRP